MPPILGQIVVIAVLGLCVALAIRSMWKGHRSGKCSCGGDCSRCGGCHRK